jgi:cytochrome c-type biogenesis protein CcmH/NrfG
MSRPKRFGTAISTIAIAAMLTGCAAGQESRQAIAPKAGAPNLGLALQAQAALSSGQSVQAVEFAERAVAATPGDSELRALLGNCYFAAGRFAAAEQA